MDKKKLNSLVHFIGSFPFFLTVFRRLKHFFNKRSKPKLTKFGFWLTGNKLMESGTFEIEETVIIKQLLKQIDVFINIGANIGYYCCFALQEKKYTIAFEPLQSNLFFLYKNMKINGWNDLVEIHPIALSNKIGTADLYGMGTGASLIKGWAGNSRRFYNTVPLNYLDNIINQRFLDKSILVVIDVEGAELGVLKGAKDLIHKDKKPVWLVEIAVSEHQPDKVKINPNLLETFQLFWDAGYRSVLANSSFKEICSDEIDKIVVEQIDTLETHNFIFFDRNIDIREWIKI